MPVGRDKITEVTMKVHTASAFIQPLQNILRTVIRLLYWLAKF